MKHYILSLAISVVFSGVCMAQDQPQNDQPLPMAQQVTGTQYETARQAIQRRAAWKAQQRLLRIDSAKWAGYSPSRPATTAMPFMGSDSWYTGQVVYFPYPGVWYPRTQLGFRSY